VPVTTPGDDRLPDCPPSPNCVCSDDPPGPRHIAPLRLRSGGDRGAGETARLRGAVETVVAALPGARITSSADGRIVAEFRSRFFGFVDDVILDIRPGRGTIAVRAAARTGFWDLGVNRRRVEAIRARLCRLGIVEPPGPPVL